MGIMHAKVFGPLERQGLSVETVPGKKFEWHASSLEAVMEASPGSARLG